MKTFVWLAALLLMIGALLWVAAMHADPELEAFGASQSGQPAGESSRVASATLPVRGAVPGDMDRIQVSSDAIRIVVVDDAGCSIAGATVSSADRGDRCVGPGQKLTQTDSRGIAFVERGVLGDGVLVVSQRGFQSESVAVASLQTPCRVVLKRGVELQVRCVDAHSDRPLPGVDLVMSRMYADARDHVPDDGNPDELAACGGLGGVSFARSARNGLAAFAGLAPGRYLLSCCSKRHAMERASPLVVEVPGDEVELRISHVYCAAGRLLNGELASAAFELPAGFVVADSPAHLIDASQLLRQGTCSYVVLALGPPPGSVDRVPMPFRGLVEGDGWVSGVGSLRPWNGVPEVLDHLESASEPVAFGSIGFSAPGLLSGGGQFAKSSIYLASSRGTVPQVSKLLPVGESVVLPAGKYRVSIVDPTLRRSVTDMPKVVEILPNQDEWVSMQTHTRLVRCQLRARYGGRSCSMVGAVRLKLGKRSWSESAHDVGRHDLLLPAGQVRLAVEVFGVRGVERLVDVVPPSDGGVLTLHYDLL